MQAVIHNPGLAFEVALTIAAPWSTTIRLGLAAYFAYVGSYGYDPLTGQTLSEPERLLAFVPALSEIARGFSIAWRGIAEVSAASRGLRFGAEAATAARLGEEASIGVDAG